MRLPWPLVMLCTLMSCSGSDSNNPRADAASYDAALGADSGEILPDAAATTECSSGDSLVLCTIASEICVETDFDGTVLAECQPLPAGCDAQRDCANCGSLCDLLTCESSLTENAITCVSL